MSTNQAIFSKTVSHSIKFVNRPDEATRKLLQQAGFTYDGKSNQWYIKESNSAVMGEADITRMFAEQPEVPSKAA